MVVLEMSEKIKIKCPHCGYEWESQSRMRLVTCPSCIQKVPNPLYEQQQAAFFMEHFNLDENGVKILDRGLISKNSPHGRIVDVHFKPNKAWCVFDESDHCKHIDYALSLPVVQEILQKHGWKIRR
jgi:hypothetical protein